MDDRAYEILQDFFDPDENDTVRSGLPPYMAPENLLYVYQCYRWIAEKEANMPVPPPSPNWAGWAENGVTALEALTALRVLIDDLIAAFGWLIHDARQTNASWTEIGNALGMTKQAAWERFRDYAHRDEWSKWPNFRAAALAALGTPPNDTSTETPPRHDRRAEPGANTQATAVTMTYSIRTSNDDGWREVGRTPHLEAGPTLAAVADERISVSASEFGVKARIEEVPLRVDIHDVVGTEPGVDVKVAVLDEDGKQIDACTTTAQ